MNRFKIIHRLAGYKRRLLPVAGAAVMALVAVALPGSAAAYRPLVEPDGWERTEGFFASPVPISPTFAPEAMRDSPALITWRSWSPQTGGTTGRLESRPFELPDYLAIAYDGDPAHAEGSGMFLSCEASGRRIVVASVRVMNTWSTAFIRTGGLCDGPARLVVVATDKDHSIGVTPPFAVSAFAYWAHTDFIPRALIVVLVWAGLIVLGLPFALEARRRGWRAQPLGFAMAGVGALAMAVFAVLTASYEAGCVAAAAVLAACLYRSFAGWRDRRAEFRRIAAENMPAMLLWLGVAILYTALIASSNSGAGSWSANEFFAPLRWSSDNHLPILFADGLISDAERAQIVFGPWLATDRGPLMAVLLVFARLLLHPLTLMADSAFAAVVYPVAGITIMSSWAALLPWFCRAAGVRRYWVVVVLVLSSPLMIFNTVYIWPKLLGASYALASFLVLSDMARQGRAIARPNLDLAAVLAVLSYLSHGSNAFTLVVIALAFALPLLRSGIVPLGLASASALLVYAPWAWWQAVVQPHGNALVRSALAGDFAFDDRERSILQDILAAYAGQDLWGWLKGKLLGLRFMTGYKVEWTSLPELVSTHAGPTWFGGARVLDFYVVVFALGISLVGVVLVAACAARVPGLSRRPAEFGFLVRAAGVGLAAVAFQLLVTVLTPVTHHVAYAALLLLLCSGAAMLAQRHRAIAAASCVLAGGYALVVWVGAPILAADRLVFTALAGMAAGAVVIVSAILALQRRVEAAN